jgi:hypothetical protein
VAAVLIGPTTTITTTTLCGDETWILREPDHENLTSFEIRCWRRMEKISRIDRERHEAVFHVVKERHIVHAIKRS